MDMGTGTVTIQIDQNSAAILQALQDKAEEHGLTLDALSLPVSRQVLELLAIQAHLAGLITSREVQEMLGFADREELFAFFKAHDVRDHSLTMEELERGRETMAALLDKR